MEEIIAHVVQPTNWIDVGTSIFSLAISVVAIIISINTYRSQKEHNKNSVRPILNILLGDYEDVLYVRVDNNGVGPAIVSSTNCTCSYFDELMSANSLVDLIPYEATIKGKNSFTTANMHSFTDFVEDITGRTIPPGGQITLLRLEKPERAQLIAFRNLLKNCCVEIGYTDIYNSEPWNCKRSLDFFGRTPISPSLHIQYVVNNKVPHSKKKA